jgi:hypothetical protein
VLTGQTQGREPHHAQVTLQGERLTSAGAMPCDADILRPARYGVVATAELEFFDLD